MSADDTTARDDRAVVELRAEVERLREASGVCYSDECREPCQSQQRQARAELHVARAAFAKASTRLGEARRALVELRVRSADLRARVRALANRADPDGDRAHEGRITPAQVRAVLAGSGEQPGEGHEPDLSDGVPDDDGKALPAGLCCVCQRPAEAHRPAPVVPDSTDVRDITDQVRYAWCWYGGATREESDQRAAQFDTLLASLAAVGQGVTAEQVEYAIDGAIPYDLPGYRQRYTEHAARRVLALLRHGDADHPSAAVRSGEKEG